MNAQLGNNMSVPVDLLSKARPPHIDIEPIEVERTHSFSSRKIPDRVVFETRK